jgi:hypothetical protein
MLIPAIVPTLQATRQAVRQPAGPLRRPPLPLPERGLTGPRSPDLLYERTHRLRHTTL